MKNKAYLILFIVSIIGIFLLEDGMIKDFSLVRFAQPFIFVSLPFLLAYLIGWKKGFISAIVISLATLAIVWFTIGERDFWFRIYGMFFASFSVVYLIVAVAISLISKRKIQPQKLGM